MARYIDNYHKAHGLILGDWIGCEVCGETAVDIHHIRPKGMGGSKRADEPSNLIALCRSCHDRAHFKAEPYLTKEDLYGLQ
jgi:5-methylcytosine-specific restriction endonuclease McrA